MAPAGCGTFYKAVLSFEVAVQDLKQLTTVMKSLERVEGVRSVERL